MTIKKMEERTVLRNWIEIAMRKQYIWPPCYVGKRGDRNVYLIEWVDGTEGDYFIDYDKEKITEVFPQ